MHRFPDLAPRWSCLTCHVQDIGEHFGDAMPGDVIVLAWWLIILGCGVSRWLSLNVHVLGLVQPGLCVT